MSLGKICHIVSLKNDSAGQLFRGAASSMLSTLVGLGATLGVQILLARLLGPTEFGAYALVLSWLGVMASIAVLGLDTTLLRYLPTYKAHSNWPLLRGLLTYSTKAALSGTLVVCGLFSITLLAFGSRLDSTLLQAFWWGCALLPILVFIKVTSATFRGLKRVILAQAPDAAIIPVTLAMLALTTPHIFLAALDSAAAVALHFVAASIALALCAYWLHTRAIPAAALTASPLYHRREWLGTGTSLFFFTAMQLALNYTDTIMIGFFMETSSAGFYAVASRLASLAGLGLAVTNQIVAPMISELYHTGRRAELQRIVSLGTAGASAFSLISIAVFASFGTYVLDFFGAEFRAGFPAWMVLAGGQTINAIMGPVGFLMTMTGHHRFAGLIVVCSAMINIIANAVLIPSHGITGAAAATAASLALWNIACFLYVYRHLQINSTALPIFLKRQ